MKQATISNLAEEFGRQGWVLGQVFETHAVAVIARQFLNLHLRKNLPAQTRVEAGRAKIRGPEKARFACIAAVQAGHDQSRRIMASLGLAARVSVHKLDPNASARKGKASCGPGNATTDYHDRGWLGRCAFRLTWPNRFQSLAF